MVWFREQPDHYLALVMWEQRVPCPMLSKKWAGKAGPTSPSYLELSISIFHFINVFSTNILVNFIQVPGVHCSAYE